MYISLALRWVAGWLLTVLLLHTGLGQEGGRDWRFEIFLMRNKTFECSLASPDQEQVRPPLACVCAPSYPIIIGVSGL